MGDAMNFEFATAGRIVFGLGAFCRLPELAALWGTRVLLVTGRVGDRHTDVIRDWAQGVAGRWAVSGEPSVADVMAGAEIARRCQADVVVGLGGGSVLDAAKAVAGLARNPGDPLEYLEVVGRGRSMPGEPLPVVAVPTTAGTGAEVTRNAVLSVPERGVKVSLRSPGLLPRVALIDPELTLTQGAAQTAASGMDALTQLLEAWVCTKANPMTDGFCQEGLRRVGQALLQVQASPTDGGVRSELSLSSLLGGLALANAGLGAVHGLAGPLGGRFSAPHGALCAALVAAVTRANLRALRTCHPQHPTLLRYDSAARWLSGDPQAHADDLPDWLAALTRQLGIPHLTQMGIRREEFTEIAEAANRSSSMKGNPCPLGLSELESILVAAG
jgi:alcohol dehydrogenase class IV